MSTEYVYGRVLGVARVASVYLIVFALLLYSRPTPWSVSSGFLLVALGEGIRVWAAGHLRKNLELVTSGPYRFTRNPLYLGRLLIFSGLCAMAPIRYGANWLILIAGWLVFFGYYLRRKERVEPARLRALHGEAYLRYQRAVPVLWPSARPYPEGASIGWSSDRMLRNREHWMVLGLGLVSLLLLWRAYDLSI